MSTRKFVDIHPKGPSVFAKYLEFLAKKKSFDWTIEHQEAFALEGLQGADAAKVDLEISADIMPQIKVFPTQVRTSQVIDSFFMEDGTWYPRLLWHEALRSVFVSEARDLDIREPAFVVGDNTGARVIAAVLAEMGIADIFLVGDLSKLQSAQEILSRQQLGIRFRLLDPNDLTLQMVSAGIVVNTMDLLEKKTLLTDLSYFNFMKRAGYVLDMSFLGESPLSEEADRAELKVLYQHRVFKAFTQLWVERLKLSDDISNEDIDVTWNDFLKENSPSV